MGSASSFNGDLSSWDVSKVTDMSWMFSGASSFNGDLSSWDVSQVTKMDNMFMSASNFNGDLRSWDVSKVTDMGKMFCESGFQRKMQWDCTGLVDDYYTAHNSWSGSSGPSDDYYKAHNSWSGSSGGSDDYQQGRSNSCACVCKSDPCNHDPFDLCSEGSCCGVGTHFVNGACVATYDGMLEACKTARGKQWAWTCEPSCSKK